MNGKVTEISSCAVQPKTDIADTYIDNREDIRNQIYRYETLIASKNWNYLK